MPKAMCRASEDYPGRAGEWPGPAARRQTTLGLLLRMLLMLLLLMMMMMMMTFWLAWGPFPVSAHVWTRTRMVKKLPRDNRHHHYHHHHSHHPHDPHDDLSSVPSFRWSAACQTGKAALPSVPSPPGGTPAKMGEGMRQRQLAMTMMNSSCELACAWTASASSVSAVGGHASRYACRCSVGASSLYSSGAWPVAVCCASRRPGSGRARERAGS